MALALAAAGRFEEAAGLERELIGSSLAGTSDSVRQLHQARLASFEDNRPWLASSPTEILGTTLGHTPSPSTSPGLPAPVGETNTPSQDQ